LKAAQFDGNSGFVLRDIEIPILGPNDILVKTSFCGVCGTDVHKAVTHSVPAGTVLGHEVAGTVVDVGMAQSCVKPGDRVVVAHHVPCYHCKYCRTGHHSLCPHYTQTNLEPGGFSEYFRASDEHVKHTLRVLPPDMPLEVACFMEPLACIIQGQRRSGVGPGDNVLILGAGPIGVLHSQMARVNGAARVIVSDPVMWRREKALALGADFALDPLAKDIIDVTKDLTDGLGADVVILCTGVPKLMVDAMKAVRRGGTVLSFAQTVDGIQLPGSRFFLDEITITGSYSSSPYDYDFALQLLRNNQIDTASMISRIYPLRELGKAIEMALSPQEGVLKVLVSGAVDN
jgi:L-iditol 2-dehydrogenase